MKPRVSTKRMGSSSTKIQGLLFNFFYSHGFYELLPVLPLHVALDKKPLPRLTHINAWEVFVIGYRRGLLALYGKFESFTWWQRFPVLNITLQGVKVGLSSQYKLRRAKGENKVFRVVTWYIRDPLIPIFLPSFGSLSPIFPKILIPEPRQKNWPHPCFTQDFHLDNFVYLQI